MLESIGTRQKVFLAAMIAGAALSGYIIPTEAAKLVQTNDIANGAVTTPKIADDAVTLAKLGSDVPTQIVTKVVSVSFTDVPPGEERTAIATCPSGMIATGGAGHATGGQEYSEFPWKSGSTTFGFGENGTTPDEWRVFAKNNGSGEMDVFATVFCAKLVP